MATTEKTTITTEAQVKAEIDKVWKAWNEPDHVIQWNTATLDWHTPKAENDFREGGRFLYRMEAKDGSFGFDFSGEYDVIKKHEYIEYTLDDGRNVKITFDQKGDSIHIVQSFEAEETNPIEMQKSGWQAILDNFKVYTEKLK